MTGGPAVSNAHGGKNIETGNFASPSRGGFALFGGRRLCQKIDRKPHNLTIGSFREKLYAYWQKSFSLN